MRDFLRRALKYLLNCLLGVAGVATLVLFSFLFTGNLTPTTYSDRMVYVALAITLLGGVVALGARSARKSFGIPSLITKPEHAKKLLDNLQPLQAKMNERFDAGIQLWFVGFLCLMFGALVQIIGAWLATRP